MNDNDKSWVDGEFGQILVGFIAFATGVTVFVVVPCIVLVTVCKFLF